ncbi:HIT family protein [Candidatus Falkowbacteria bacterium HGW-Falkowbacteria-1]|uniref:HIT family protein n=1 Tax=Candidatus Falkowbacteria bacterium HGW-Falkowbacteria-1 TaxID=2013768 RepID=A0A2N2E9X5_9BACT|nr:MAG: HIT family protein [Candidatus Falkowbacteria bacterium HGW-Falkowbacteria-1]
MKDCIFCKIVKGEIPSVEIFQDKVAKVFLNINPASKGHLLIIPKEHFENILDCPDEILSHLIKISKKMAQLVKEKLGADAVNIANNSGKEAGQEVFHLHFHVVPRYKDDGMKLDFIGKKDLKDDLEEIRKIIIS